MKDGASLIARHNHPLWGNYSQTATFCEMTDTPQGVLPLFSNAIGSRFCVLIVQPLATEMFVFNKMLNNGRTKILAL